MHCTILINCISDIKEGKIDYSIRMPFLTLKFH